LRSALGLLAALIALPLLAVSCADDERTTLTVFAAASLTDAFREIAQAFEAAHPNAEVRLSFGGSQRLRLQIEQGAGADLFASANRVQIERAEALGVLRPPAQRFAANALALIVPARNPAGLSSLRDLATRNVRLVIAGEGVPAGDLTRALLEARGLADDILRRVVSEEESVRRVLTKVRLGEADAGFVYSTDALAGGEDVMSVPIDAGQLRNEYLLALTGDTEHPDLAAAFVEFVLAPEAQAILARLGFIPLAELQ